jgi:NADH-quinone oxidoreductase subunit C
MPNDFMSADIARALKEKFPAATDRPSSDHPAVNVPAAGLVAALTFLREEQGYDLLMDLTAVDWAEGASPRFTLVYHVMPSTRPGDYLRVASDCPDDASPSMPTAVNIWPAANWHERECFDMFGIKFAGHPDLRRILMWDEYPYHPLRKDFPLAGIEVPLPGADVGEETGTKVIAAPMAGGPFVASTGEINLTEAEPRAKDESWSDRRPQPGQSGLRQIKE